MGDREGDGRSNQNDSSPNEDTMDSRKRSFTLSLIRLVSYAVYAFVMKTLGYNISRIERKIERRLDNIEDRLDTFGRRLSIIGLLVTVFVVFAIVVQVVWLFVGIVWLVKNTPVSFSPLVFVAGLVLGYAACLVTGVIYMRR